MMAADPFSRIYSATYSNVPVYEFGVEGNHVMRRRADDWINATHILKVADFDKPARTRILEREVQKGVHEKVQGGYGKYQGTWVPLAEGRLLAQRNNVLDKLLPIFDFVPGDRSPPPAPKHATAASSRPKAPRAAAVKRQPSFPVPQRASQDHFEEATVPYDDPETPDNDTVISESMFDDQDFLGASQYSVGGSRKRKRGDDPMSVHDQQHQIWADALLDYFMLLESDDRFPAPPEPPAGVNLDRPIDDKGHTAMHWAAAMGDVDVVRDLIRRGARIDCLSNNLETPLMRAVMFTNNFDKNTMPSMVRLFQQTVTHTDWFNSTVFHHVATTTSSTNKYVCARYYLDCIIAKLSETWRPDEITRLLDAQDKNGDTAVIIAARHGARKCVRSLLGRNVTTDVPNAKGETADDIIRDLNERRRHSRARHASSSPFAPDGHLGVGGGARSLAANGDSAAVATATSLLAFPPSSSSAALHASLGLPTGAAALAPAAAAATGYRSQTASHLMEKIAPTLLEKCQALAAAYEAELAEKEAESADAENVVRKRQAEIDAVRRQLLELGPLGGGEPDGDQHHNPHHQHRPSSSGMLENGGAGAEAGGPVADGASQRELAELDELDRLVRESEALLELEQRAALRARIARALEDPPPHAKPASTPADEAAPAAAADEDSVPEKARLAALLARAQADRRELVAKVADALGAAGVGRRTGEYKRLIVGALGVREEDVEGMLPEILGELEEAREREVIEGGPGSPG